MQMRGHIAVAELEPRFASKGTEPFEGMKSLPAETPALRPIHDPGKGIGHDVEIGRNAQPVEDDVVARVDDDVEPCWIALPI